MVSKDRYWRGEVQSESHAEKVINYTAGGFAVLAALFALSAFSPSGRTTALLGVVVGALSLSLYRTKALLAARVLFGLCALTVGLSVFGAILIVANGDPTGVAFLVIALFWLVMSLAAWRACQAAQFLRSRPMASVFE